MKDVSTRERLIKERAGVVREFEEATREWIGAGGEASKKSREGLAERLRAGYWLLDPYVRARSIYDRSGLIREGGKVCFYDPPPSTAAAAVPNGPIPARHAPDGLD